MGQVGIALGEGDGELAGGVDVAGEDVGERLGAADAGIPGLDDAGDLVDPGHGGGAAGFEHDDGFGVGGGDGFNERVLLVARARVCRSKPSDSHW